MKSGIIRGKPSGVDLQAYGEEQSLYFDQSHSSSTLLVCFGGLYRGFGLPPYEFRQMAKDLPVSKLYIRDLNQSWYHNGLLGHSTDLEGTYGCLSELLQQVPHSRVVAFGVSMGGYAALLFGSHLPFHEIHAFCPQSFLGPARRFFFRERRWKHETSNLYKTCGYHRRTYDLRAALQSATNYPPMHIYYSASHTLDASHALRLRSVESIQLHPYDSGSHGLVRQLKLSGELDRIIRTSIQNEE